MGNAKYACQNQWLERPEAAEAAQKRWAEAGAGAGMVAQTLLKYAASVKKGIATRIRVAHLQSYRFDSVAVVDYSGYFPMYQTSWPRRWLWVMWRNQVRTRQLVSQTCSCNIDTMDRSGPRSCGQTLLYLAELSVSFFATRYGRSLQATSTSNCSMNMWRMKRT